jgi:hypothetical protein
LYPDEIKALKPGESKNIHEFEGKQISGWPKRVCVLRRYYTGGALTEKQNVSSSGSKKQKKSGGNASVTWNWKISGNVNVDFDAPDIYAYTIPDSLNSWKDSYYQGYDLKTNAYFNPSSEYPNKPVLSGAFNFSYVFAFPGNIIPAYNQLKCPNISCWVSKQLVLLEEWDSEKQTIAYTLKGLDNKPEMRLSAGAGPRSASVHSSYKPFCIIKWKVE